MVSDQLKQYLDTVKKGLVDAGWSESDVREAFQQMEKPVSSSVAPLATGLPHAPVKRLRLRFLISVLISGVVVIIGGGAFLSWQKHVGLVNKIVSGITHETPSSVKGTDIATSIGSIYTSNKLPIPSPVGVDENHTTDSTLNNTSQLPLASNDLDPTVSVIDCKNDLVCLSAAAKTCASARATHTLVADLFGVSVDSTYEYVITKPDIASESCSLGLVLKNLHIGFSDRIKEQILSSGISEEQIQQQEEKSRNLVHTKPGDTGTCVFDKKEDLVVLIERRRTGDSQISIKCKNLFDGCETTSEFSKATCSGPLFEISNTLPSTTYYVTRDTSIRMDWPFAVEFVRSASNEVVIRLIPDKDTLCPTKEIDITESNSYSCKDSTYSFSIDKEHTTKDGIAFFAIHNK